MCIRPREEGNVLLVVYKRVYWLVGARFPA
jgi:hypothetical protein